MKATLKNGIEIELIPADVSHAKALIDYITQVVAETKNLLREPEEWNMTIEQEEAYLRGVASSKDQYMVIALDGNKVISAASFAGSSLQRANHVVSLGISCLQDYHNLGLGTIVMNHLIEKAKEYNKKIIQLDVRVDNESAIHLYKKVGFKEEGIHKNAFYVDDTYVDLLCMAIYLD